MSTTIDQRVVEMQFNNKQFEANVATSMSTIDKLKQKLNFTGASKGLEHVNSAAKNVNMSGLGKAVDSVHMRFSALEVMGVTALANITNSAVNAGKRIASALTIDPIKTGLSEYETKMNAIQVIKANTDNSMDEITSALNDLNEYADNTIYNFAQMTDNIGKFTAQGFDVFESSNAVKGLANLAAASGASAQDMARATYQMSQALGSSVKLMDWNSLRNANMATQDLKNTLIALAKTHGVAIDEMIAKEGSFEQTLQDGWLSGEMFTEAMNIYSGVYTEAELAAKGFTSEQIKGFQELAAKATSAATEVKTVSQLWDVLQETAQSGWTQTWELIIGDFDTAKATLTKLQVYFSDIINGWSDARNILLGGALNMKLPWSNITEKLDKAGLGKIKEVAKSVTDVTDKLEYFQKVVDDVWRGDYKNSDTGRFELLEKAGYDHRVVQDLVNKGSEYKLTIEDVEASHKKFGLTMDKTSKSTEKAKVAFEELSDEKLKDAGLTEAEIKLYRDLEAEAKRTGVTIEELVDDMSKNDGRTMLIDSFKNAWAGLTTVFKAVRDAWVEIFPPMSVVQLYGIIKNIRDFSENLKVTDETAGKLKRTFKGVFAIIDIIATITGGALKMAFKAVSEILGHFDLSILDVTANIGDTIVAVRDWINAHNPLTKAIEFLLPYLERAAEGIRNWINTLKESDNLPRDIILGLVNGLRSGVSTVVSIVFELGKKIIETICNVLGIHSPSKEFFDIGMNTMIGFSQGVKKYALIVWDVIKSIFFKIIDIVKEIDFGHVMTILFVTGVLSAVNKMASALESLASPLEGLGDMFENAGIMMKNFGKGVKKFLNAKAFESRSRGILTLALAVGVLAASVYVLSGINAASLWKAVGAVGALAGVIIALLVISSKVDSKDGGTFGKISGLMLSMAASMLIMSFAVKQLTGIKWKEDWPALAALAGLLVAMAIVIKIANKTEAKVTGLLKMSFAMLVMVGVIKVASLLQADEIKRGLTVVGILGILFVAVIAVSKLAGEYASKAGSMLLKMSVAMLIMVGVIKLAGMLSLSEVSRGLAVIAVVEILFMAIIAVSWLAGKHASKAGSMMLKMSIALLVMSFVIRLMADLDGSTVERGLRVIKSVGVLFLAFMAVSALAGQNANKAGTMLLLMSVALLIMTGVLFLISQLDPSGLDQALTVVKTLVILFGGIIAVTSLIKGSEGEIKAARGTLIVLTVCLTLLVGALAVLTLLDPGALKRSTACLAIIMGTLALLINSTKALKGTKSLTKPLLTMVGVIGLLALIMGLMTKFNAAPSMSAALAMSTLLVAMAGALSMLDVVLDKVGKVSTSAIGSMALLGLIVGEIGIILGLLTYFDVTPSIETASALSVLLISMSASLILLSNVGAMSMFASAGIKALATLVLTLGGILIAIGALMDYFPSLETFLDKGIPVLEKIGYALGSFFGNIVGGVLGGIMEGVGQALPGLADSLSDFMTRLQPFLEGAKNVDPSVMDGVKAIAETILILTAANVLEGLTSWLTGGTDLSAFGEELVPFGESLKGFSDAVDGVNPEKVAAAAKAATELAKMSQEVPNEGGLISYITGENSLAAFGGELVSFGESLAGFATAVSDVNPEKVTAAAKAATELAKMSQEVPNEGGLISYITGENSIAKFGTDLIALGTGLLGFSMAVSGMDVEAVSAATTAATKLAEMSHKVPNEGGLISYITGENSIAKFGFDLIALGMGLKGFSDQVIGMDGEAVAIATTAATKLAEMSQNIPNSDGLAQYLVGEKSIAKFGNDLVALGAGLKGFSDQVVGINPVAVMTATMAAKYLADMSQNVPSKGGLQEYIVGEKSISKFGADLINLGKGLKGFSDNVIGINPAAVFVATTALSSLADMSQNVPNSGGLEQILTGNKSIAKFGGELIKLGEGLAGFSTAVSGIEDPEKAIAAAEIAGVIAKMTNDIPLTGGVASWFEGDESLAAFAGELKKLGEGIAGFSAAVVDIKPDAVAGASAAAAEIATMLSTDVSNINWESAQWFAEDLPGIGDAYKKFSDNISGIDVSSIYAFSNAVKVLSGAFASVDAGELSSATTSISKLSNLAKTLLGTDFSGLNNFATQIGNIGDAGVNKFIETFKNAYSDASAAGKGMVDSLINGVENKYPDLVSTGKTSSKKLVEGVDNSKSVVKTAFAGIAGSAVTAIRELYDSFYNAGAYLVDGMAAGISDNDYKVEAKAAAMATAAKQAAEEALGIESPSKVFYKIGAFTGQGFINALGDYENKVYGAGVNIADSARNGLSGAIGNIVDVINSDVDTQPTIRPVLDLSDVRSGAKSIDGMLQFGSSVGVLSRVGTINAMMNQRVQNATNDDVVSAIKDLRDDLGNVGGTSYNINGVTYDDGSNIANAVKSIVRAARIERRV